MRLFGSPDYTPPGDDINMLFEVLATVQTPTLPVLVTRAGGLLVPWTDDRTERGENESERDAWAINLVLCELAMSGVISAPASPIFMGFARVQRHPTFDRDLAIVTTGGGGPREVP